ncbi:leucyl/phenylalanyl-tRNA--protein transferase [Moraxella oblonga]|uniref:leucyl/phenylalanyl-tRNA--protein transferase n=1 Tax=Moraxella oblonga TaxID=200413 RepID=UPI00082EC538|nr:leucyl/phenylalanyl-tRNA--protein transferase [Moraxella oblonga]
MTKFITLDQFHTLADTCPYDFRGAVANLALLDDFECGGYLGGGADLSVPTLLHAYRCGVFPWFNQGENIAWWSPNERCVICPVDFQPKKSLIRTAKRQAWTLSVNLAFDEVIKACSQPRAYTDETWIGHDMIQAYNDLNHLGVAISVEVWDGTPTQSQLIGGLYGVTVGRVFCGESMFHRQTDASKIAFWGLMSLCVQCGIELVDCQLENPHLMSLGARIMPRKVYLSMLDELSQSSMAKPLQLIEPFGVGELLSWQQLSHHKYGD